MKQINSFILEKLKINKDSKNLEIYDWDATKFKKGDIVYINPNIVRGVNKPGKPGIPLFFIVVWNHGKSLKITEINSCIISGDESEGEIMPNEKVLFDSMIVPIKDEIAKVKGGYVLYLWDGSAEKFYNK